MTLQQLTPTASSGRGSDRSEEAVPLASSKSRALCADCCLSISLVTNSSILQCRLYNSVVPRLVFSDTRTVPRDPSRRGMGMQKSSIILILIPSDPAESSSFRVSHLSLIWR